MSSGVRKYLNRLVAPLLPGRITRSAGELDRSQIWSIGIYAGVSPLEMSSLRTARNPVLTSASVSDVAACFVADPFMIRVNDTWHMFFEVMNLKSGKGEIGWALSPDGLVWTYQHIVLKEPFHLSYPYVFEWDGEYYMTPESCNAHSVRLYKAVEFPQKWSFIGDLVAGDLFSDPSIFRLNNSWWLFTDTSGSPYFAGTLRLFGAQNLLGPWSEHPKSPIVQDAPHMARPAGRVTFIGDKAFRYAQDCLPVYGTQVRAFEIVELTPTTYRDREAQSNPVLAEGIWEWNESGMHHIDPHLMNDGKWIACVDGFTWRKSAGRAN